MTTRAEKEVAGLSWYPSLPEDWGGRREGGRRPVWGSCSDAPCLAGDSLLAQQTHLLLPGAVACRVAHVCFRDRDNFLLGLLELGSGWLSPSRADVAPRWHRSMPRWQRGVVSCGLYFGSK